MSEYKPDKYLNTSQSSVGYILEEKFYKFLMHQVQQGKLRKEDFKWYKNKDNKVHYKNLAGHDFDIIQNKQIIVIDVKSYKTLSGYNKDANNFVWIEYKKERLDNGQKEWEHLHYGIFDKNYEADIIMYGDYTYNILLTLYKEELIAFINWNKNILDGSHNKISYDEFGATKVWDWTIPVKMLCDNHLVHSITDLDNYNVYKDIDYNTYLYVIKQKSEIFIHSLDNYNQAAL